MVEPAELRPDELDRIEDALELLEVAGIDDPSPGVRERLGDFRRILQLSRTALPLVDVPRGVFERVMLEARHAAEVPVVAPVAPDPAATEPSFWGKLRRFALVPGVALAGAAALVLIMVQRSDDGARLPASAQPEVVAKIEPAEGHAGDTARIDAQQSAELREAPPPPPGSPAPDTLADEPAAAAGAPPTPAASRSPAAITVPPVTTESSRKGKDLGFADDAAPKEESASEAKADPADADGATPRWDIIARGDRARHKGDCDGARTEYELALGDFDARVRARAHAGIGLCSAADGSQGAADSAYKAARELDPEITGFIDTERPRGGGSGSANAARTKAKKAKPAPPQQKANAFEPADPME